MQQKRQNAECKHTSGHADVETLNAVFETVKPKFGIIPIHTENPEKFIELFPEQNIIYLRDREVFTNYPLHFAAHPYAPDNPTSNAIPYSLFCQWRY